MKKKEADRKRKADEKKEARGHKKRKQQWWEEETDAGKARSADGDADNAYYKEQVTASYRTAEADNYSHD